MPEIITYHYYLQELNVKLSKMSKQLEALQAALDANNRNSAGGTASSSAHTGKHKQESDDEKTEVERKERFGDDS